VAKKKKRYQKRSKLTPEVIEKVCRAIRIGGNFEDAARFAGISIAAFYRWKAKGEKAESGIQREFVEALGQAVSDGKLVHLQNLNGLAIGGKSYIETRTLERADGTIEVTTITKTLLPDAATSKWILGRRFPDEWGKQREERTDENVVDETGEDDADGLESTLDAYIEENGESPSD